jgi:hypothetical protein
MWSALLSVFKQKVDLSDVYVTLQELITPKPEIDCVADNFFVRFCNAGLKESH